MKQMIIILFSIFLFSSCVKQTPIPQEQLTGIWKLNGFSSTTYVMEITKDGYLYWFNYMDDAHYTREFEWEYNMNNNTLYLYNPGRNTVIHSFRIYQQRNGRLYFSVTNSAGLDPNGNPITRTDTYYQMN